jgi:hypothetical protein
MLYTYDPRATLSDLAIAAAIPKDRKWLYSSRSLTLPMNGGFPTMKSAAGHFAGIGQTVPDEEGTEIILESTANKPGDAFHRMWKAAKAGKSKAAATPVLILAAAAAVAAIVIATEGSDSK